MDGSRIRRVTTDSWRSYMRDGAPDADMDERGPLHGHAEGGATGPRVRALRRGLGRVFQRRGARVGAILLLLALGVLLVRHWTGPAHALTAEERAQRFLARTERDAGRVPADEAYVTVAASPRDAAGVFALAASLVAARTTRLLRVLVTPDVPVPVRTQLARLPNVAALTLVHPGGGDGAPAHVLARLAVWQLADLAHAVYLAPDVVVRRNTDALFVLRPRAEGLYAAYDTDADAVCSGAGAPPRALNSSVMVLRPSARVHDRLVAAAAALARNRTRAQALTEADVIQAVFEDSESGVWWKPLPRPLYGLAVEHICACGPLVAERARVVQFPTETLSPANSVPGPGIHNGNAGSLATLGENRGKGIEENVNETAIRLRACAFQHFKVWRKFYRDAQKLLL